MASDSGSSHTGTYSQGLSPLPGLPEALPPPRTTKASMGGILSPSSARRRTSVKGDMPSLMKRAVSSPNVRDLANFDTSAMSSAEKKRNKLGYHRTSVACVHCRRRKIRCIIATDDPTPRCHNCIRLKKDCQFYAVDQQPAPGKRTTSSSKADESINESPTPEESPALASTPWDHSEGYGAGYLQSSLSASDSPGNFAFGGSVLQSEGSAMSSASYSSANAYPQSPWSSTPVLNSPLHSIEAGQYDPSHWQSRGQPGPPSYEFSSYPPSAMQTPLHSSNQEHFPHFSNSQVGEPQGFSHMPYHPVRSMSLATPNDLQDYHSPYNHDHQTFLQRQPTNNTAIHPQSLSSNTNPTPPSSEKHSTPSAYVYGDHPQSILAYQSNAPMQSPSMAVSNSDAFGTPWYVTPTGLADVKEEEEMANLQNHHHHHHQVSNRFKQNPG